MRVTGGQRAVTAKASRFPRQITAAATAITVTAASHVVFAEASWVPADDLQAAKRVRRIGQTRPVLVRFVSLAGSLDEATTDVLRRKARLLAQVMDEGGTPCSRSGSAPRPRPSSRRCCSWCRRWPT
jgi:hypothetical protein